MDIERFIEELEASVQGAAPGMFGPATRFRELPIWDSLAALTVLSVVDALYGLQMNAHQLRSCGTLQEIHDLAMRLRKP